MKYTALPDEFPTPEAFQLLRDYYVKKTVDKEQVLICGLNVLGNAGHMYLNKGEPVPMRSIAPKADAVMAAWDQACSEGMKAGGLFLSVLLPIVIGIVQDLLLNKR